MKTKVNFELNREHSQKFRYEKYKIAF